MKKVRKTGKNMRKRLAAALAAGCMALGLCQAAKPLTVSADTAYTQAMPHLPGMWGA